MHIMDNYWTSGDVWTCSFCLNENQEDEAYDKRSDDTIWCRRCHKEFRIESVAVRFDWLISPTGEVYE